MFYTLVVFLNSSVAKHRLNSFSCRIFTCVVDFIANGVLKGCAICPLIYDTGSLLGSYELVLVHCHWTSDF